MTALLQRRATPLPQVLGFPTEPPLLMGIVNVTPDSFYDGGRHRKAADAVAHGLNLMAEGADILDVGGESTRPGAEPVSLAEELHRVLPVIEGLAANGAVVSIDTRHAAVMTQAVAAGAQLINDIAALSEPGSLEAAAALDVPAVLMHCDGDPKTMQNNPTYDDVVLDVYDYLEARIKACGEAGIPRERLVCDPGIGFAKTPEHNAELLAALPMFHGLGVPLLLGVSRKSCIGHFSNAKNPGDRLPGSLAAALWAYAQGTQILRVHDVAATRQALAVWQASSGIGSLPALD